MSQVDPEVSRKRLETGLKWGGGIAGVIALGFLTPFIISGVIGAGAALVAGVVGYVALQLWPVFAFKVANARMKMIVAEATENPIETMQNLYAEKQEELLQADNNIAEFETEVRSYDDQLAGFKEQYPDEAHTYQEISDKMGEALQDMKSEQSGARQELKNFALQIKKAQAIWKMALAAQKVVKLSKSAEAQVFAQIKEQVAFDSVRNQLNRSFANLNLAIDRRRDAKALPAGNAVRELPTAPHAVVREPAPFPERESSAFPRERTKERN